jgi:lipid-binding SYLF domain-containing protein
MQKTVIRLFALAFVVALAACGQMRRPLPDQAQAIVNSAADTIERFKTDPNMKDFYTHVPGARALVVLPHVYKAGFIGAAEGGNGVLIAKGGQGGWGAPAFYTLAAGSVGFQIGIQDVEMVLVIRSEKALQSVLKHQAKFGADAGITVGVFGAGMEAATTTNVGPDVLVFARSRLGLFAGVSLEGAGLVRRADLNEAAYGAGATPQAIVLEGRYAYPAADRLRATLGG